MKPLYPIPDRDGNYTPEQIHECVRVDAVLAAERKQEAGARTRRWIASIATVGVFIVCVIIGVVVMEMQHGANAANPPRDVRIPERGFSKIRLPERRKSVSFSMMSESPEYALKRAINEAVEAMKKATAEMEKHNAGVRKDRNVDENDNPIPLK